MSAIRQKTTEQLVQRGFALHSAGRFELAEHTFRAAAVRDPDDEDAWIGLGCSMVEQGRHAEAAIVFGMAAAMARSNGAWPTLLAAEALAECGQDQKARAALAWFTELAETTAVQQEQRDAAARIVARLERTP